MIEHFAVLERYFRHEKAQAVMPNLHDNAINDSAFGSTAKMLDIRSVKCRIIAEAALFAGIMC